MRRQLVLAFSAVALLAGLRAAQQFAAGVTDVFVNGVQVLRGGEPTGATPGQVLRGPGWTGWREAK